MSDTTPPPGSDDAVRSGCKCPILDSACGKGNGFFSDGTPAYWINESCPLHGTKDAA